MSEDCEHLAWLKATYFRGAGARRERGIKAADVEADIGGAARNYLDSRFNHRLPPICWTSSAWMTVIPES